MRKHLPLTLQHRAGVRPNTSSYEFAESCVFTKQSPPPILCHLFQVALKKVPFIPKLQGQFAEFLQRSSLKRLSLFDLSTCVGFGYGLFWRFFPGELKNLHSLKFSSPSKILVIFLEQIPIGYSIRFFLRDRITLRGLAYRRNPWTYGENVSHILYRYSCQHFQLWCFKLVLQLAFFNTQGIPLPS